MFIDVGAGVGAYAKIARSAKRIMCFEPDPRCVVELKKKLGGRVELFPIALGAWNGLQKFHIANSILHSSLVKPTAQEKTTILVAVEMLDNYVDKVEDGEEVVVKMDTEGAEHLILEGGRRFIAMHKPTLLIEYHNNLRDVYNLLRKYGYEIVRIEQDTKAGFEHGWIVSEYADRKVLVLFQEGLGDLHCNTSKRAELSNNPMGDIHLLGDIDLLVDEVEPALRAAADLISTLERYGVTKSIIVKWSGQGVHIHVNDQAFSPSLFEAWSPLDVAYAVTEFIMGRCGEHGSSVKVENKVDPGRVFTSPLSLHREVDRVCVCIPPDEVLSFAAEWASPKSFRHYLEWDGFEPGEADALAITALETIGPYTGKMKRKRLHPPLDYEIDRLLKRFGKGDACTTHRA
ncbi:MAG: FkbM family methyltransferase [Nitrososphaerota archaeon]